MKKTFFPDHSVCVKGKYTRLLTSLSRERIGKMEDNLTSADPKEKRDTERLR